LTETLPGELYPPDSFDIILNLIEALYTHAGGTVTIGKSFLIAFPRVCSRPALFLAAIDWIGHDVGNSVGHSHFTDLAYADDSESVLQSFNALAAQLCLKLSWSKTKLQNVGAGACRRQGCAWIPQWITESYP